MQFNDTTNYNGLIQRCETNCALGRGDISGNTDLLKLFTNYINEANNKVVSALMRVDKRWQHDDYNYTDLPRATADLVSLQQDYTLPAATSGGNASTMLGLVKLAVKDVNSTPLEHVLQLTDLSESQLNNMFRSDTPGLPTYYKLVGNSVKIWPRPSSTYCTMTAGLVAYFKRTPTPFTTTSTTTQPGFMATYHPILALDASATYLKPNNPQLAASYALDFKNGLDDLLNDYADMDEDIKNQIKPVKRNPR